MSRKGHNGDVKVLLVEDDPAIAGSVTTSLSNAGMTVHHCATDETRHQKNSADFQASDRFAQP